MQFIFENIFISNIVLNIFMILIFGLVGATIFRHNIIIMFAILEILGILLCILLVISSFIYNSLLGSIFILLLFVIAGCEIALALVFVINYYAYFISIDVIKFSKFRGL